MSRSSKTNIVMPVGVDAGKTVSVTQSQADRILAAFGTYRGAAVTKTDKALTASKARISELEAALADSNARIAELEAALADAGEDADVNTDASNDGAS